LTVAGLICEEIESQRPLGPEILHQTTPDLTLRAAPSSPFNTNSALAQVWCDAQGSLLSGKSPTAADTNAPIAPGAPEYFSFSDQSGYMLSVRTNP
jgi:hypothetical protein